MLGDNEAAEKTPEKPSSLEPTRLGRTSKRVLNKKKNAPQKQQETRNTPVLSVARAVQAKNNTV